MTAPTERIGGEWWVSDDEHHKWLGHLVVSAFEAPKLELLIRHHDAKDAEPPSFANMLHGYDRNGRPCSLFFCSRSSCSISTIMTDVTYSIGYVLRGYAFAEWKQVTFNAVWFELTHFNSWMNRPGFKFFPWKKNRQRVEFVRPKDIKFPISKTSALTIFAASGGPNQAIGQTEVRLTQTYKLKLSSLRHQHLTHWLELITKIRRLLTLGVGRGVSTTSIEGLRRDHHTKIRERKYREAIPVQFSRKKYYGEESTMIPQNMVFSYTDVSVDFTDVLSKWLKLCETHDDAMALVFGRFDDFGNDGRFLEIARACEIYHRTKHRGRHQVAHRIESLLNENATLLSRFIGEPFSLFSKAVQDTRDYEMHRSAELLQAGKVRRGAAVFDLSAKLQVLLQVCFMKDVGLSDPILRRAIRKYWHSIDFR